MLKRRSFLKTLVSGSAVVATATVANAATGTSPAKWDKTFDVIVIGSGGAGLTAGVVAKEKGANVVIVEKQPFIGGNTLISGGGFNAAVAEDSKKAKVEDSPALHAKQTLAAGDFRANPELVSLLTSEAPNSVQWLKDHGVKFRDGIYQIYGGLWPRARNPEGQQGQAYIKALGEQTKKLDIPVMTRHKVISVIREEPLSGKVIGIEVETPEGKQYWKAEKGVVAAAGGFSANAELCGEFDPRLVKLNTTNQPGATGEVLIALQDIGAGTTGLDYIQCIPGAAPGYKQSANLHQTVEYFIFVNQEGKRFVPEDARRDVIRDAVLQQTGLTVYEIVDADGFAAQTYQSDRNKKALEGGYLFKADSVEDLAKQLKIDPVAFKKTIEEYNAAVDAKKDALGRSSSMLTKKIQKAPFYGCPVGQARHHTMGGVRINKQAQVLDRKGQVIPGLYAAGEVTGGIHGSNRVGGNAIADIFTFGRIAGESASAGK